MSRLNCTVSGSPGGASGAARVTAPRPRASETQSPQNRMIFIGRIFVCYYPPPGPGGGGFRTLEDSMIDFEVANEGRPGPALLLVHGFPLDRRIWSDVTGRLPLAGPLVLPDLRGHGRSALPPGPCTIEDFAGDLLALMDHLGRRTFFAA